MTRALGLALVAIGFVLFIFGMNASESLASDVSRFFTGEPTDRAMWLIIGGVAGIIGGGVMAALPVRKLTS
jgi:hypothetical protein